MSNKESNITLGQFEAITTLMGARTSSVSYRAAKLVLVDGLSQAEVTATLKTKKNTVQNGITRYREAFELIKKEFKQT